MNNEERFDKIVVHIKALLLMNLRTQARLKALEAMVENTLIPSNKVDAWHARLNKESNVQLQQTLESLEKLDPGFAAMVDQRGLSESDDLE